MISAVIPVRFGSPSFRERVTLSGEEFVLDFRYSEREGAWYMSVSDVDIVPIVESVKIVLGVPLLRQCVDVRKPAGDFIATDTTGVDLEPTTVADMADTESPPRVNLIYIDATA